MGGNHQPGPGSESRAASTDMSYRLPAGMDPEGPCMHPVNEHRRCRKPGKAMLDAMATMETGSPVYGHRCPRHRFRP